MKRYWKHRIRFRLIPGLLTIILCGCGNDGNDTTDERINVHHPVMTTMIIEEMVDRPILCRGVVYPLNQEKLSFLTAGEVGAIYSPAGSRVQKGDTLALLAVTWLTKEWVENGLALMKARSNLERLQELLDEGSISEEEFKAEEEKTNLLRNFYFYAKKSLKNPFLIAPCDGKVREWSISHGDSVSGGQSIGEIINISPNAIASVNMHETEYFHIAIGDAAVVTPMDELALPFEGEVISKSVSGGNVELPFTADVLFENPGGAITMGTEVMVNIEGEYRQKTVLIPSDVLIERRGPDGAVFLTDDQGRFAIRRHVQLGPEIGNRIIVEQGLHRGDRLIVHGHRNLVHGSHIAIIQTR